MCNQRPWTTSQCQHCPTNTKDIRQNRKRSHKINQGQSNPPGVTRLHQELPDQDWKRFQKNWRIKLSALSENMSLQFLLWQFAYCLVGQQIEPEAVASSSSVDSAAWVCGLAEFWSWKHFEKHWSLGTSINPVSTVVEELKLQDTETRTQPAGNGTKLHLHSVTPKTRSQKPDAWEIFCCLSVSVCACVCVSEYWLRSL